MTSHLNLKSENSNQNQPLFKLPSKRFLMTSLLPFLVLEVFFPLTFQNDVSLDGEPANSPIIYSFLKLEFHIEEKTSLC